MTEGHPVSYSQTTLTELMIPAYANFGGKIHGGTLASLILESTDEIRRFCSALRRRRLRSFASEHMEEYKKDFRVDDEVRAFVADERCVIQLGD